MICANQPQPRIIQLYFSLQMNTWWKLTRGEDILCSSLRQMQFEIILQIQNPTAKKHFSSPMLSRARPCVSSFLIFNQIKSLETNRAAGSHVASPTPTPKHHRTPRRGDTRICGGAPQNIHLMSYPHWYCLQSTVHTCYLDRCFGCNWGQ